jgi:endonuclease/exonuclease/phosphatase family metal-dependent hydrolase
LVGLTGKQRLSALAGLVLLSATVLGANFLYWGAQSRDAGEPTLEFPIDRLDVAARSEKPDALKIMTWNIAYARGGAWLAGETHSRREVVGVLERVAHHVQKNDPDILALQEVDLASDRTSNVDELAWLQRRLKYPYAAWVTTWEVRYVPYPPWPVREHAGGIHMGMAVLSKYPITSNVRHRLPEPDETSFVYDAFYVKRAVQAVGIDVGGERLHVFNTHLESMFLANRIRQIGVMGAVVEEVCACGENGACPRCVVLGDMNSPPTGGAFDEGAMEHIAAALPTFVDPFAASGDGPTMWTFPAQEPARRLDHVLYGPGLLPSHAEVYHAAGAVSDHLPLVVIFQTSEGSE